MKAKLQHHRKGCSQCAEYAGKSIFVKRTWCKLPGGRITHWALTHPGPEPDFHRRDGFVAEI